MKKKICLLIVSLCLILGFVNAQSITFDVQGDGEFGYGCLVPIDVYVDTQGQEISAMDLMLESSMEYKDFENTDALPYYFPPVLKENGLVHIIGFSVEKNERFNGNEKIGTLYFRQKDKSIDGALKMFFLGEGETIDSNLSIAGGIDVLRQFGDAYVKFSEDLPACEEELVNQELNEIEGYSDKNFDEYLQETINQIERDHPSADNAMNNEELKMNNWCLYLCIGVGVILLIVIICVIYKILSNKKKNTQGNN